MQLGTPKFSMSRVVASPVPARVDEPCAASQTFVLLTRLLARQAAREWLTNSAEISNVPAPLPCDFSQSIATDE
jgi:hypothetical protein